MLTKRTSILFSEDLWKQLVKISKEFNVSTSEFIRKVLKEKLEREEKLLKMRKAVEEIRRIRPKPVKGKIDYKELINYGRKGE